jgi:hypothetical protein
MDALFRHPAAAQSDDARRLVRTRSPARWLARFLASRGARARGRASEPCMLLSEEVAKSFLLVVLLRACAGGYLLMLLLLLLMLEDSKPPHGREEASAGVWFFQKVERSGFGCCCYTPRGTPYRMHDGDGQRAKARTTLGRKTGPHPQDDRDSEEDGRVFARCLALPRLRHIADESKPREKQNPQ